MKYKADDNKKNKFNKNITSNTIINIVKRSLIRILINNYKVNYLKQFLNITKLKKKKAVYKVKKKKKVALKVNKKTNKLTVNFKVLNIN